ncbi:hypothetical protein tb265_15850 [Gemmatimonadetes bacterium T265]|nr:hypothetical protein tb265_15850 [Gemmatimonadetes bacterium T265]
MFLPRPRNGLRRHRIEDQVLVYDARTDRTHLLDHATGTVLDLLEEGGRPPEALVVELGRRIDRPADDALVTLALDELRKAELLDEDRSPAPLNEVSRRQLLRRAGLVGATALLVPTIVSLTANPLYAASPSPCSQSSGRLAGCKCSMLTGSSVCASGCCKSNGSSGNGENTCVAKGSGIQCY